MSFTSDPGKSLVGQRGDHTLSMSSRKLILSIFGFQEFLDFLQQGVCGKYLNKNVSFVFIVGSIPRANLFISAGLWIPKKPKLALKVII